MSLELKDKRIVIASFGIPHPKQGASLVLYFHYVKALIDQGADILHLISAPLNEATDKKVDAYITALGPTAKISIELTESQSPITTTRFNMNVDATAFQKFKSRLDAFAADAALVFDLPAAILLNQFNIKYKTIWLGDLTFQSYWYNYIYGVKEDFSTARWIVYALVQRYHWKKLYKKTLSSYDDIIVSSKSSENELSKLGLTSTFLPYPWPAGELVVAETEGSLPRKPTFLFFGNLVGLGSRSSLHFLFEKIYPLLIKQWGQGGFSILIGGRELPRDWVLPAIAERPEIEYIGFIENLATCVAGCHAVIAPMDVPVGNRSRILTAWSMKALVISHVNASLGNPSLIDGETAYLAKDAKTFVEKMVLSVKNRDIVKIIVDQAYATYLKEYAPESASNVFVDLIKN